MVIIGNDPVSIESITTCYKGTIYGEQLRNEDTQIIDARQVVELIRNEQ